MFTEDITAIVVDVGSLSLKAGYSGEDTPRLVMPSQVCINREQNQYYVGENKLNIRHDNTDLIYTYKNGLVQDFDAFEKLLQDVYDNQIRVSPNDYCLLMSESSIHNTEQREKICEIAFEKLNVPNFFIVKSGVLSCFSSGRSTALILDTGAYSTYAIPVHDGFALQKCVVKFDIGGEYLTDKILNYIEKEEKKVVQPRYALQFAKDVPKKIEQYLNFPNTLQSYELYCKHQIARDIKENICRVDDKGLTVGEMQLERTEYELPDGNFIHFDTARSKFSEYFFSPFENSDMAEEDSLKFRGMHHMVLEAINQCDIDIKRQLFNNIILTGGNSLLSGFSSRLQNKLNDISPPNSKVKMIAYPSSVERKFSSWIGGSILASLGSFQSLWIGKQEYMEHGKSIVEKKCN